MRIDKLDGHAHPHAFEPSKLPAGRPTCCLLSATTLNRVSLVTDREGRAGLNELVQRMETEVKDAVLADILAEAVSMTPGTPYAEQACQSVH